MKFLIGFLITVQSYAFSESTPVWNRSESEIHQCILNLEADLVEMECIIFNNSPSPYSNKLLKIINQIKHDFTMSEL